MLNKPLNRHLYIHAVISWHGKLTTKLKLEHETKFLLK